MSYAHKHRIEAYFHLKNCGLNTPQIFMGTSQSIAKQLYSSDYPLIIKPIMGSGSKGIKIINSSEELKNYDDKILYVEKFIEGTHYLAYFIHDQICVGEKQPFADEHAEINFIKPKKDIKKVLMCWRKKYNLLFGHLDMIREKNSHRLIIVDPGTFPEFSNWKCGNNFAAKICQLILKRYEEKRDKT